MEYFIRNGPYWEVNDDFWNEELNPEPFKAFKESEKKQLN